MDDEDHIELSKIGMRYGARIAVALAVFAIGGGLLFTTGGILFSEHPNLDLAYGIVIASLLLIGSGIGIVCWSGSETHKEINNLRTKPTSHDNCKDVIQEKLKSLKTLEMSDPGLLKASDLHNIVKTQMDLTTSLSDQQHNDIIQLEKSSSRLEKLTYGLLVLTGVLIVLTIFSLMESQHTSELLTTLTKTNDLMLANLYSNYELKFQYDVLTFERPGKLGGFMYDLKVLNTGDYDAQVNSTWYVINDQCGNGEKYTSENPLQKISNSISKSDILAKKGGMATYIMEIPKIFPNYTNSKEFTIKIISQGTPIMLDKTPVLYFTKSKVTRVQFVYDNSTKDWIPTTGWYELTCDGNPPKIHSPELTLDTANPAHFRDFD